MIHNMMLNFFTTVWGILGWYYVFISIEINFAVNIQLLGIRLGEPNHFQTAETKAFLLHKHFLNYSIVFCLL